MAAIFISLFIILSHNFSHHSLCHLFIQSYLAFQMLIMPLTSNPNVQGWFEHYGLPWSDVIATQLLNDRIKRVEETKLLPSDMFLDLFSAEQFIV